MQRGNGRTSESAASAVATNYARRVGELVSDWCRLESETALTAKLINDVVRLAAPFPTPSDPAVPSLCADGSPVEISERLSPRACGPALTCDPASRRIKPADRLRQSLRAACAAVSAIPNAAEMVTKTANSLYSDPSVQNAGAAAWVGVNADGLDHLKWKVYLSFDGRPPAQIAARCESALSRISHTSVSQASRIFDFVAAHGYLRMLSLSFGNRGYVGAKLYARLKRVDLDVIRNLAHLGNLPTDPFDLYVRRVLRRQRTWFDGRAGIGVAFDEAGSFVGAALYHYTAGYFASDQQLRERLLAAAPEFGWDPSAYRLVSRLFDSGGSRARFLLAVGVSSSGGCGLRAYAGTGYLAAA